MCEAIALTIDRLPTGDGVRGEYHVHCDNCGAETFMLKGE